MDAVECSVCKRWYDPVRDDRCPFCELATLRTRLAAVEAERDRDKPKLTRLDLEIEWFERLIDEDGPRGSDIGGYESLLHKLRQVRGDIPSMPPSRAEMDRFFADALKEDNHDLLRKQREEMRAERDAAIKRAEAAELRVSVDLETACDDDATIGRLQAERDKALALLRRFDELTISQHARLTHIQPCGCVFCEVHAALHPESKTAD